MNASSQAMLHGFFDFENFDLEEYEHYEVRSTMHPIGLDDPLDSI